MKFEWGGQEFKIDTEKPLGSGGKNCTTHGGAVEALDELGFTCYFPLGPRGHRRLHPSTDHKVRGPHRLLRGYPPQALRGLANSRGPQFTLNARILSW